MHATEHQGRVCPEPTRRLDGRPETDIDRRFFELRESGYAGWIDQDGYAVTDAQAAELWDRWRQDGTAHPLTVAEPVGYEVTEAGFNTLAEAPADVPGTVCRVLRSAARYLQRYGWQQGAYYDMTATVFTPAADMAGAIGMVCYGGPVEAPAQHFDDPGFLDFEEAVLHLDRYLLVADGTTCYQFNDAPGRQVHDVLHVLRQAADTPAAELIDALRALNTRTAEMQAIADLLTPCGLWAERSASAPATGGDAR